MPSGDRWRFIGRVYDLSSLLIVSLLLVSLLAAIEAGYHVGRWTARDATEPSRTHVNTVQASLLGVLALLLGFSFSMALQRHENRSLAVADEANAIGTTYLRAELIPASVREPTRELLRQFLDLRVKAGSVSLERSDERRKLLRQIDRVLNQLWINARRTAEEDSRPVTSGLFIQSLNEMIDAYGKRNASVARHVPELVLGLLYGTFILTAGVVGYAAGFAGHRASFATYMMVGLIVMLVFIIIDLDRPRRGFIEVNQEPLLELQRSMGQPGTDSAPR